MLPALPSPHFVPQPTDKSRQELIPPRPRRHPAPAAAAPRHAANPDTAPYRTTSQPHHRRKAYLRDGSSAGSVGAGTLGG
ncbi:hypothetical protein MXD58_020530, partial [Frankia sp. AgKG'84/4]